MTTGKELLDELMSQPKREPIPSLPDTIAMEGFVSDGETTPVFATDNTVMELDEAFDNGSGDPICYSSVETIACTGPRNVPGVNE